MLDQAPKSRRFEFRSGFVVDCHGWIPRLAKLAVTWMGHPYEIRWGLSQILPYRGANGRSRLQAVPGPYAKSSMI
jgi:hypothetical protein